MVKILCMLWSAVITSVWWAYGSIIDIPISEWDSGLQFLWALFFFANAWTLFFIIYVTLDFIKKLCQCWKD